MILDRSRKILVGAATAQRGTVLLLALIVMSSVVLSSMGLGTLIVSSIQQSRIIDDATIAYYAAESGAEDALYSVRRLDALPPDVTNQPRALANGATWTRTVTSTENDIYIDSIPKDSFAELPLYDADTSLSAGATAVTVTWTGTGMLSASLVGWKTGTAWDSENAQDVDIASGPPQSSPAILSVPSTDKLYRLRLRATEGDLSGVRVEGFTGDPPVTAVPLPGRVDIVSRGSFGGTQQKLVVSLPRKAPLAGIYDFVVFSECSIVKGGATDCP